MLYHDTGRCPFLGTSHILSIIHYNITNEIMTALIRRNTDMLEYIIECGIDGRWSMDALYTYPICTLQTLRCKFITS